MGYIKLKLDNQDLIIEILNEKNKDEYKSKNGFKKFKKRNVLIKVRGKPGITMKYYLLKMGRLFQKMLMELNQFNRIK